MEYYTNTKKSVFILDNASYHKSQKLKELFEKHGHVMLFLPPYSPDLNPIEKLWGNLKRQLRNYYDYSKTLLENLKLVICDYTL